VSVIIGNQLVLEPVTLELARNRQALAAELGVPIDPAWPNPEFAELLESDIAEETEFWVMVHVKEMKMIGEIGTKSLSNAPESLSGKVVEIGYGLVPEYRGKGLGTEAVRLLCDWLFAVATVRAVRAETEPDNLASARVLLKNGFEPIGQSNGLYLFERK
jgi:[ribosomal protein S5]-alanine N-acetyltransferase